MANAFTADAVYGGPVITPEQSPSAQAGGHPTGRAEDGADPHDPSDRGPSAFFDDPTFWVVAVAALATGVIGLRFNAAGRTIDVGDEIAAMVSTSLYAIVGIILFKTAASKIEVPGLQRMAAAI